MSDGTRWRPMVHVEDICRALAAVVEAPRDVVHDQAYNVGRSSENYQVRDLVDMVKETVSGCQLEHIGKGGPGPRDYRVSFDKLARTFPASPSAPEGLYEF